MGPFGNFFNNPLQPPFGQLGSFGWDGRGNPLRPPESGVARLYELRMEQQRFAEAVRASVQARLEAAPFPKPKRVIDTTARKLERDGEKGLTREYE